MRYTYEDLRSRAFERVAHALYSFWEEQRYKKPRAARVHSRIFEPLIYNEYIELNKKTSERSYGEHVVPCAYIRNYAFEMFWDGKRTEDVASMIGRLLRIAYITPEERKRVDAVHVSTMPSDWNPESDSILRRLKDAGVEVQFEEVG